MTNLIALPSGTELVGDYKIQRVLGAGGFGVTYLADEIALDRVVTIKEYFPSDFAARSDGVEAAPRSQDCASDYKWGLDRFIEEAQTLAKFTHPNIVRVYRYFRANNTGYMVLHFEEGQSLKSWLKSLGRAPRQKELDAIIAPILDALEVIHKSDFLHRDIAPDNIIIRKAGDPVLIDFGSARREIAHHSKTVSALVKPGYSPYEQYAETSRQQGAWSDIYALAATLYQAITGKRPPDAPSRMVQDEFVPAREAALGAYRATFLKAIDKALSLNVEARPQSIAEWRGELLAPDPPRPGWLTRRAKKNQEVPEPALAAAEANGAPPVVEATAVPPPPDAPGPQGGMLDFLDGLKRKTEPKGEVAPAASPKDASEKAKGKADAKAPLPPTVKIERAPPSFLKREKKALPVPVPKANVQPKAKREKRKPPRPRRIKGTTFSWRPLVFKLLIGAGIASAAVAWQNELPQVQSRGSAVTSSYTVENLLVGELKGHEGAVGTVNYSDDGRWIVTSGSDATLRVWDAGSSKPVRTIQLDDGPALTVALSGTQALTGHGNGRIVLWNLENAEKISTFQRNEAGIWSVAFSPGNPDRFASASHDWKVALWDIHTPTAPVHIFEGHESAAQAVAFSPKGPRFASGSADKTVKLWDLKTLDNVRTYRGHRDFVTALSFSPNGRIIAAASLDGSIRLWSAFSGRLMRTLYGHKRRVGSVAFSPDGEMMASASDDGTVRLWNVKRGRTIRTLVDGTGATKGVSFSRDGQRLAAAGDDGVVRLYSMPLPKLAKED
jgi:serine/threonine protein kinase